MDVGVPRERQSYESRAGLTPAGVELLRAGGHNCYVHLAAARAPFFCVWTLETQLI